MVNSTWAYTHIIPPTDDYTNSSNWTAGVPTINDTGFFGISDVTSITILPVADVCGWVFSTNARQYTLSVGNGGGGGLVFFGEGIVLNGGGCHIDLNTISNLINLAFSNNSTAGSALITEESGQIWFNDISTAGRANIVNMGEVHFKQSSTAESAVIHTLAGGKTFFLDSSTGGNALLNTDTGGEVDFSQSKGPNGDFKLSVGSIAGAGTYQLGADQLTVGLEGVSTNVSGLIEDGGAGGGALASLVIRAGSLTLSHAFDTYSGGTTIERGALEVAAIGAAGTGPISFESTGKAKATLEIDNAALSGHIFATNKIDLFGKHDVLDLTGLHFHAGATAKYHPATDVLAVRSGHVTDKLTLVSPHGTHFETASDHHGGTEVFLFFA
jgi:autotransporter-associated beta strand protein